MPIFPFPLAMLLAGAFIGLLCLVLFLNIFGLPANWFILGLDALWAIAFPDSFSLFFWLAMASLAIVGEILELVIQVFHGRKYGSSTSGAFAGMIGAFLGAILFAPLFWGIGALIGALLGAWCGCFLIEMLKGRETALALKAAFGAMIGRFLGAILKLGIGAAMIALTFRNIWPELPVPQGEEIDYASWLGIMLC